MEVIKYFTPEETRELIEIIPSIIHQINNYLTDLEGWGYISANININNKVIEIITNRLNKAAEDENYNEFIDYEI
ncbi:MAG: hypothetical protein LBM99_00695 [Bacillales bacterium]|jgi:hypothetical protein|nr:hypothetical protein [Bacillales bacterium]